MPYSVKFFSLNKKEDWIKGLSSNLDISDDGLSILSCLGQNEKDYISKGTFISHAFDSLNKETVWKRAASDFELVEGAHINVSFYASDSKLVLINGSPVNLDQYIEDSDTRLSDKIICLEQFFKNAVSDTTDSLMINTIGRYLWIKVDIIGSQGKSPKLKRLRLYMDSGSYLSYLPEVYQEDKESKQFLDRFLAIFQTFFNDMEEGIDNISNYFEPEIVPADFLEWLAGCVGIDNVSVWSESQLRKLIGNAYEIYQRKGTRQGISDIVEYFTGEKPIIVEHFQYCDFVKDKEAGEVLRKLYGENPYVFNVFVRQEVVPDIDRSITISRIIDWQKPAHTEARLIVLKPNICLNSYTFLGVNTFLTEQTVLKLDHNTSLPYNAILIDR